MKKVDITEIDYALKDFPDNLVKLIKASLDNRNSGKKLTARSNLVRIGKTIIPQLHKLLESENVLLRMEVAKIVELIADRRSIPILIRLLDDKEFEIRWIAAEGLIKIGRRSILPLLKSVRDGESSYFHNKGAHHILNSLLNESEKKKLKPLLLSLDDFHELGETAPVEAYVAIKILFKRKKQI
jgi:HEAT repeat protein